MGTIRCARCGKKRDASKGSCVCGEWKCVIVLYWKGRHYWYRRFHDGGFLDYERAFTTLSAIRVEITKKAFDPVDWTDKKLKEYKFEYKVNEWLVQKEEALLSGDLSPSYMTNLRGYIVNYYLPFFTGWDVRDIKFEQLEAFKDGLPPTIKKKTKRNIIMSLHSFFTWLFRKGIRDIPPFPTVEGDDAKARVALDYEEQTQALQAIPERYRDPISFGIETGLRPGEICALKVKDIDLRHGLALVQRTWSASTHLKETTKTNRKRFLPLNDMAAAIAARNMAGKFPEAFLFVNPDTGSHYRVKMLNVLWKRFTGLDVTYYEGSRHSLATWLVQNADLAQAQEALGHTDIRTTRRYVHLNNNRLRDILNSRAKLIELKKTAKE